MTGPSLRNVTGGRAGSGRTGGQQEASEGLLRHPAERWQWLVEEKTGKGQVLAESERWTRGLEMDWMAACQGMGSGKTPSLLV